MKTEAFPIYVPSKGRAGMATTVDLLEAAGLAFTIVVEPQEAEIYRAMYEGASVLELPLNDQGIAYVRQYVLENARANGFDWFWMLDDDIKMFHQIYQGRAAKTDAKTALVGSQGIFLQTPGVGIAALDYQQFAWNAKQPGVLNGYAEVCVCINVYQTRNIGYRKEATLKEDRDFVLQCLSQGIRSARVTMFAFTVPKNASNKGGLQKVYQEEGREARASKAMCELWKGICEPQLKADGRPDVKIHWELFKSV